MYVMMGEHVLVGKVTVIAPGHLHVGNIDLTGDLGRLYGTLGFTLEYPKTKVVLEFSDKVEIIGQDRGNAEKYFEKASKFLGLDNVGVKVIVEETIPKHIGMGSQTALALSIGLGLAKLYKVNVDLKELALALGRSSISALGFYSFTKGGFIIDGGFKKKLKGKMVPPLIFRKEIPENWFLVVAVPQKPLPKILAIKSMEDAILESMEPMPPEFSDKVARIVLMQIMPSAVEEDIEVFGKGITAFNRALGEFWKEKQGGIYCDPIVEEGIEFMLKNGAYGACQTSWGPTFYGLVEGENNAKTLLDKIKKFLYSKGGGFAFYTRVRNRGAEVVIE